MQPAATLPRAPTRPLHLPWSEVRNLLRLALPVVAAELGWMGMWLVDTMMVGRVGTAAIGAVSIGGGVFFAITIFGIGLLLGLDYLVAHAIGAGRVADAHRALVAGVYLSGILTVLLTGVVAVVILALPSSGIEPTVLAGAVPYLVATTWGLLPLLLFATLRRYLQARGLVGVVMVAIVSANVLNAAVNWVLVFGNLGAPALGAVGAGWATTISRVYMLLVLAAYLAWHERRRDSGLRRVALLADGPMLRRVARLGLPAAVQTTLEVGVFTLATLLAGTLDATALAAHQLALNTAALTFMVPLGISSAAAVCVARALGRNDGTGAGRAGSAALAIGITFMGAAALLFVTAPHALMRVFTTEPAVIATGASLLLVAAAFQLFDGVQVVATGILRGIGDTRTPLVANLLGHWTFGFPVGCALCFGLGWGVVGLWIGLTLGLMAVAVALLAVWVRRARELAA